MLIRCHNFLIRQFSNRFLVSCETELKLRRYQTNERGMESLREDAAASSKAMNEFWGHASRGAQRWNTSDSVANPDGSNKASNEPVVRQNPKGPYEKLYT